MILPPIFYVLLCLWLLGLPLGKFTLAIFTLEKCLYVGKEALGEGLNLMFGYVGPIAALFLS